VCVIGSLLLYGTTQKFSKLLGLNYIFVLTNLKEIDLLMNKGKIPTEKIDETE
tara:strand:- start:661 stop:819 length:159 start_codon:yes stop_codon:yes gene_type:complete